MNPAYVSALVDGFDFDNWRSDLLYTAFAEHLSRTESLFDTLDPLAYWRGETGVIDCVLRADTVPVPIMRRNDSDDVSPADVFSAFRDAERGEASPHLEIVVGDPAIGPARMKTDAGAVRLPMPDWLLLTVHK